MRFSFVASGGGQSLRLAYSILQAAGCRSFKTDYVLAVLRADVIQSADRHGSYQRPDDPS